MIMLYIVQIFTIFCCCNFFQTVHVEIASGTQTDIDSNLKDVDKDLNLDTDQETGLVPLHKAALFLLNQVCGF